MHPASSFVLLRDGRLLCLRRVVARGDAWVYLASLDGRDVAVKLLRDRDPWLEAWILRAVVHPHIVALADEVSQGLVLEWVAGAPLNRAFSQLPSVLQARLLGKAAADALDALDVLHHRGFAHGAIHADHLRIDAEGHLRIVGFGRAGALSADRSAEGDVASLARTTLAAMPSFDKAVTRPERAVLETLQRAAAGAFRSAAAAREAILDGAPMLDSLSAPIRNNTIPMTSATLPSVTLPSLYSR
jgi:serine/threonine protein kinase